jgi:hypothetical protein
MGLRDTGIDWIAAARQPGGKVGCKKPPVGSQSAGFAERAN